MGKKGKRSKQKDAKKEADKITKESNKLMDEARNNDLEGLYSKAVKQMREAIRLLESKKELMVYTRGRQLLTYVTLMILEYQRRNYKAALDCGNYYMANSRHSSESREYISLYHQLIMLRLNGQDCQVSDLIHVISRNDKYAIGLLYIEAIFAFRVRKLYDSAIQLEMACGSLIRSPIERKLSLALTYLEQYRLDFHKRSEMRRKDFSTMDSLITSLQTEYPVEKAGCAAYYLVLAQWHYLSHTLTADKRAQEESISKAIDFVDKFLHSTILAREGDFTKMKQDFCYTCNQAVTSTEVQYVCSGCRVACYCSIDHQRITWKKDALNGMRIGHEVLCPLYKTYRKFLQARNNKNLEKELEMDWRLDRECVKFLEYGLGLKNKCFPCEYQSMSESWHSSKV